MEYILRTKQPGCFLCEAFQGEEDRDNLVLFRGNTCAVIMNRYPYNNGHLMVAPYRHIASLDEQSDEENAETMELARRCTVVLREAMNPGGFNIGMNIGAAAGAGLKEHLHLHVVPRWEGDTNFMPVTAGTKVIPQDLYELGDQLKRALKKS